MTVPYTSVVSCSLIANIGVDEAESSSMRKAMRGGVTKNSFFGAACWTGGIEAKYLRLAAWLIDFGREGMRSGSAVFSTN